MATQEGYTMLQDRGLGMVPPYDVWSDDEGRYDPFAWTPPKNKGAEYSEDQSDSQWNSSCNLDAATSETPYKRTH